MPWRLCDAKTHYAKAFSYLPRSCLPSFAFTSMSDWKNKGNKNTTLSIQMFFCTNGKCVMSQTHPGPPPLWAHLWCIWSQCMRQSAWGPAFTQFEVNSHPCNGTWLNVPHSHLTHHVDEQLPQWLEEKNNFMSCARATDNYKKMSTHFYVLLCWVSSACFHLALCSGPHVPHCIQYGSSGQVDHSLLRAQLLARERQYEFQFNHCANKFKTYIQTIITG